MDVNCLLSNFWDRWELLYFMFERAEHRQVICRKDQEKKADHWPDCDMLPLGQTKLIKLILRYMTSYMKTNFYA